VTPKLPSLAELPEPPARRSGWPWTEECRRLPPTRPDGTPWPRISIVTPAFNQARYLEETLRSVLLQGYPDLEYIVVNGGSTDDSQVIIDRYAPFLATRIAQPNRGQGADINRGFEEATGGLFSYLNSDDVLLPGALERAALEIDPERGRHVVMGRCLFTDSDGRPLGIEHPSRFRSHARVLEVWKGHTIPQPSVFWTAEVWRECGPILEDSWVDYGLFCRFSRRYRFHPLDQVLSTYRLHSESKTVTSGEERRLRQVVAISRRYWGPVWSPRRFRLALSYQMFRLDRRGRAMRRLRTARELWRCRQRLRSLSRAVLATLLAPERVLRSAILPALARRARGAAHRALQRLSSSAPSAATEALLLHEQAWSDGWVGPLLTRFVEVPGGASRLRLAGEVDLSYLPGPLTLAVTVEGTEAGRPRFDRSGAWDLRLSLPSPARAGRLRVEIVADGYFVPHHHMGNRDHRPLAWRLVALEAEP
jgi:glycosyltransferase involved in cell wall biosynthesis